MFKTMKKVMAFLLIVCVISFMFLVNVIPAFATADVKVDFEGNVSDARITDVGGITFNGDDLWYFYQPYGIVKTMYAYIKSQSMDATTARFSLPAGKVLKSLMIASNYETNTGTVVLSSAGNPDVKYQEVGNTSATVETGWVNPSPEITVTVTNPSACWDTAFDDMVYGDAVKAETTTTTTTTESSSNTTTSDTSNPKTGDAGLLSLGMIAVASASGFVFLRKKEKK